MIEADSESTWVGDGHLSTAGRNAFGSITIDQLIALNDEMRALVRAGVPLDRGLTNVGREMGGRTGALALRLADRLERGESLDSALGSDPAGVPEFYRAVIEAGVRSGRPAKALEGLATYARNFAETRRALSLALLYPILVLLLAYALFILFVLLIAPKMSEVFATFRFETLPALVFFEWLGSHLILWAPIVPIGVILTGFWWLASGRAASLRPGRLSGMLRWIPGLGKVLELSQASDFAELLALMIENGVPIVDAIGIASAASGSERLQGSAAELVEGLRSGQPLAKLAKTSDAVPPMLVWVLSSSGASGPLAPALRHASETYRQRAARRTETLCAVLPPLLICVIASFAVVIYTVAVFYPLSVIWNELAIPIND